MKGEGATLASSPYDEWGCDPNAPLMTRVAAYAVAGFLRAVYATAKIKILQPEIHEHLLSSPGGSYIGVFWHKHIGLPLAIFSKPSCACLVSRSRDGELLARIMVALGLKAIRGSSSSIDGRNKGGSTALRQLLRSAEAGFYPVVTPDGPKGPPEKIKAGVIHLAAMSEIPIVPIGIAVSRSIRLSTWDGTLIPFPFARVVLSYGDFLRIEKSDDPSVIESMKNELEKRLQAANAHALSSIQASEE